jgi:NAD(P)-dependent dehydrogenase (short-subunit alcohol dehydrogenase family)
LQYINNKYALQQETMKRRFENQVVLVTGAGAGIGLAVARALAAEGANVVIGDRNLQGAQAASNELRLLGVRSLPVLLELGKHEHIAPAMNSTIREFGRLDVVANCAAVMGELKPLLENSADDWREIFEINLMGTVLLSQAALPHILNGKRGGAIVNVLALQAEMPLPFHAPYAASKAALASFTRSLAVEFAEQGIRANGIAIGPVFTQSVVDALSLGVETALSDADAKAATLTGKIGRPEEIANAVCFLASEDASYLAGAIVPVDGGRRLSRKADPFLQALEEEFGTAKP